MGKSDPPRSAQAMALSNDFWRVFCLGASAAPAPLPWLSLQARAAAPSATSSARSTPEYTPEYSFLCFCNVSSKPARNHSIQTRKCCAKSANVGEIILLPRASSSTLKGEAPRRGAISMHLGAFSAGNPIFAAGEPLCCCQWCQALGAGRSDARLSDVGPSCQGPALGWTLPWPAGCRLLGAAVGSAFGSALCELAPGEALGDCPSAELSGRVSHRQGAGGGVGCAALGRIFACCCLCRVRAPCPSAHATAPLRARTRLRASSRWCLGRLGVCSARLP